MVLLVLYNVFGNCRNVIDKTLVDNEEYADRDIEDLPPEIDSIENTIFSCDPNITLKRVQVRNICRFVKNHYISLILDGSCICWTFGPE